MHMSINLTNMFIVTFKTLELQLYMHFRLYSLQVILRFDDTDQDQVDA